MLTYRVKLDPASLNRCPEGSVEQPVRAVKMLLDYIEEYRSVNAPCR